MRKIKLMALLLATLMIVSAFAGCAGVKKEELDALDVRVQALEDLLNGQQKDLEDIKNQIADIDNSEVLDAIESIKTDLEDKIKDVNDRVDDEVGKADTSVTVSDAVKTEQQKALAKIEVQRAAYTTNSYKYSKENYEKISEALGTATGAVNAATTVEGVAKALAAMDAELKKYLTYQDMAYKYYIDLLGNVNVDAADLVDEAKNFLKEVKAVYDEPVKFTGTMDGSDPYEDNEIEGYRAELAFFAKEGTSRARDQYIDMYNAVFVLCELYSGAADVSKDLYYVNAKGKVDVKNLKTIAGYKKDAEDLVDVIGKVVGEEGLVYSQVATSNFQKVGATYSKYETYVDGAGFLGGDKLIDLVTNKAEIIEAAETVKLLEEAAEEFLKVVRVSAKKQADPFYFYNLLVETNQERLLEADLPARDGFLGKKDVWVADIYEDVENALADWVAEFELSEANKLAIIAFRYSAAPNSTHLGNTNYETDGDYDVNGEKHSYDYYGRDITAANVVSYSSDKYTNDLLVAAYNDFKTGIAEDIIELNNLASANVTMVQLYKQIEKDYADFFVLQDGSNLASAKYLEKLDVNLYNVPTAGAHKYDGSKNMLVILRDSGIFDEYAEERLEVLLDTQAGIDPTSTYAEYLALKYEIKDDTTTPENEKDNWKNGLNGMAVIDYDNDDGYKKVDADKNEVYGTYTATLKSGNRTDGTPYDGTKAEDYEVTFTEAYKDADKIKLIDLYTFESDRRNLELDRSAEIKQIYFNAEDTDDDVSTYLLVTDHRAMGDFYRFFVETYPAIDLAATYINAQIDALDKKITVHDNKDYTELAGDYVLITSQDGNPAWPLRPDGETEAQYFARPEVVAQQNALKDAMAIITSNSSVAATSPLTVPADTADSKNTFAFGNATLTYSGSTFNNTGMIDAAGTTVDAENVYVPVTDVYDREYIDLDGNKKDEKYTNWDANGDGVIGTDEYATYFDAYLNTMRPVVVKGTDNKPVVDANTGFWSYQLRGVRNGIDYNITIRAFKELYTGFEALLDLDQFEADRAEKADLLDYLFAEGLELVKALDLIPYVRSFTVGSNYVSGSTNITPNTVVIYNDINGNGKYDADNAAEVASAVPFSGTYLINLSLENDVNTVWDRLVAWRKLGGDHTLERFVAYTDNYNKTYANVFVMEGFNPDEAIKVKQTGEVIEMLYKQVADLKELANRFINTVKMADKVNEKNAFSALFNASSKEFNGNVRTPAADPAYYTWITKDLLTVEVGGAGIYRKHEGKYGIVSKNGSWYQGETLNTTYDAVNTPVAQLANATWSKMGFLEQAVKHYRIFEFENVTYIGDATNDYKAIGGTTLYYTNEGYTSYAPFDTAAADYAKYDLLAVKGYIIDSLDNKLTASTDAMEIDHLYTLLVSVSAAKSVAEIERLVKSHNEEVMANTLRDKDLIIWIEATSALKDEYDIDADANTTEDWPVTFNLFGTGYAYKTGVTLPTLTIFDFDELVEVEERWEKEQNIRLNP